MDWEDYEKRVTNYENQGMTRSDAQGTVDMELMQENQMTDDMKRLMRYINRFHANGSWAINQEDAIPSLESLEKMELIERNDKGDRWRLTQ